MSNPISAQIRTGTVGELLVQLRLLQFGVQAAPPLKDSGNDLIAIRGEVIRTIQVKTNTTGDPSWGKLPDHFHILALVSLDGENNEIHLDSSAVYFVPRQALVEVKPNDGSLERFRICQRLIDELFSPRD